MMETFVYNSSDMCSTVPGWEDNQKLSKFDSLLRSKWDKAMVEGHFRYQLDKLETRVIPGKKKFVAQLNVKRATERRKPQAISTVNQSFDPAQFNFTKIKQEEVLFRLHQSDESQHINDVGKSPGNQIENLVIVNVSPLEYGHVLMVPDVNGLLPQLLNEQSVKLALHCMLLSSHPGFRIGFNSLCAFASVNHLHFHAYYLEHELFVETCPVDHLEGLLYELTVMPCKGFAFQLHGTDIEKLCSAIHKVAQYLREHEIAHNLYATKGTVFGEDPVGGKRTIRLYLWPRKKVVGVKDVAAFNAAVVELGGHFPIKVEELFTGLTEELIERTLGEEQLDLETYEKVRTDVIKLMKDNS